MPPRSTPESFWKRAEKQANGCWIWSGCKTPDGYGQVLYQGRALLAHRLAYELSKGPIPEESEVDHKCRVRACVNPNHLDAVTPTENNIRRRHSHCNRGHRLSGRNLYINPCSQQRVCRKCLCIYQRNYLTRKRSAVFENRKMPRLAYLVILFFCFCLSASAQDYTSTTNNGFKKPTVGSITNWGVYIDGNLDQLDSMMGVHWDGVNYPHTQVGLAAALAAACNGTIPGVLILDASSTQVWTIMTSFITVPSNCTVVGPGKNTLVLQATAASVSTPVLLASSATHVRLLNFGIDGNRQNNSNVFQGIQATSVSDVVIDGMRVSNVLGNGIEFDGATSYVTLTNNELYQNGVFNGSAASIDIFPGANGANNIRIGPNNRIHDSNAGILVQNPTSSSLLTSDVSVSGNDFYANAEDNVSVSALFGGGIIRGLTVTDNRMKCTGWTANGTGFPAACTPGFLQTGAVASGAGVGVDLIENGDQLIVQPLVQGNSIHDSTFEAIATNGNINPVVNTSGTAVTWVSGANFNTGWKSGQVFQINSIDYKIASVASGTSLTLQSSAGTQTGVGTFGHTFMWASIIGNELYNNGSQLGVGSYAGPGIFCQFADGNAYQGNVARNAYEEGIQLNACDFTSLSGNKFYSNGRGTVANHIAGIGIQASMGTSINGDVTDDPRTSPTQTIGIAIDNLANNTGSSNTICNSTSIYATTPVNDPLGTLLTTIGCGNTGGAMAAQKINQSAATKFAGTCTLGTSCVITFATAYTSTPVCIGTDQTAIAAVKSAPSNTGVTFTGTGTDVIAWACFGNPN